MLCLRSPQGCSPPGDIATPVPVPSPSLTVLAQPTPGSPTASVARSRDFLISYFTQCHLTAACDAVHAPSLHAAFALCPSLSFFADTFFPHLLEPLFCGHHWRFLGTQPRPIFLLPLHTPIRISSSTSADGFRTQLQPRIFSCDPALHTLQDVEVSPLGKRTYLTQ